MTGERREPQNASRLALLSGGKEGENRRYGSRQARPMPTRRYLQGVKSKRDKNNMGEDIDERRKSGKKLDNWQSHLEGEKDLDGSGQSHINVGIQTRKR